MKNRHEAVVRLRGAWWVLDRRAQQIFSILEGERQRTRAVGGMVRDTILGRHGPDNDLDLATELLPDEVMRRARGAGMSCYPTGFDHGTITVRNGPVLAEITTLREDVVTDGRRAEGRFGTDWKADAMRRGFTINALYADGEGGLFDPLDGFDDLLAGRVRFIGEPDQRIGEDRLRVFRFFRFTAAIAHEEFDPGGLAACQRAAGNLGNLSAERVGAEMIRILGQPRIAATLAMMTKTGVMAFDVSDLVAMARYEDETQSPVVSARLAILMGHLSPEYFRDSWRLSNSLIREAGEVRHTAELMNRGALHEAAYRHGRLAYVALPVAAAIGDWTGEQLAEVRDFWQQVQVPPFPIDGKDLMAQGFEQGPRLGKALRAAEADWIRSGFQLDREALLTRLSDHLSR